MNRLEQLRRDLTIKTAMSDSVNYIVSPHNWDKSTFRYKDTNPSITKSKLISFNSFIDVVEGEDYKQLNDEQLTVLYDKYCCFILAYQRTDVSGRVIPYTLLEEYCDRELRKHIVKTERKPEHNLVLLYRQENIIYSFSELYYSAEIQRSVEAYKNFAKEYSRKMVEQ